MSQIEVIVETENGRPLRTGYHQGQFYVGGARGQRYQLRVRNLTSGRVLVVASVDGRNILTGKPGDWNDRGHVLSAHETYVFTGWRTSDEAVAAFVFGAKSDSYSTQLGTPQNVGVIGLAVFEEKVAPQPVFVPVPYPVPVTIPERQTWRARGSLRTTSIGDNTGSPLRSTGGDLFLGGDTKGPAATVCSVGGSGFGAAPFDGGLERGPQQLGTSFGQTLTSRVTTTSFVKATTSPCQVVEIRYDDYDALVRAGILFQAPQEPAPQAFPSSGYCPPPLVRAR